MAHFSKFLWIIVLAGAAVAINMVRYPEISEALIGVLDTDKDPSSEEEISLGTEQDANAPEPEQAPPRRGSLDVYTESTAEVEAHAPRTFSTAELRLAEGGLLTLPDSRKWVRPIPPPPSLYAEMEEFEEEEVSPSDSSYATSYTPRAPRREDYGNPYGAPNEEEEESALSPTPFMSPRDDLREERPWNSPTVVEETPSRDEEPDSPRSEFSNPWARPATNYAFDNEETFAPHRMTTLPENINEEPHLDEPDAFSYEEEPDQFANEDNSDGRNADEIRSAMIDERPSRASEERTSPEPYAGWSDDEEDVEEVSTEIASEPAASGSRWDWSSPSSRTPSVDRTASERSTTGRRSYPDPAVAALEASREPEPTGPPLSHYGRPTSTLPASTPSTSSGSDARSGASTGETSSWRPRLPGTIEGVSAPLSSSQPAPTIRPLPPVMGG